MKSEEEKKKINAIIFEIKPNIINIAENNSKITINIQLNEKITKIIFRNKIKHLQ